MEDIAIINGDTKYLLIYINYSYSACINVGLG